MDLKKICRICLKECGQLIYLFENSNVCENNISMLWCFCLGDNIDINDGYPENICENCAVVLVQFYNLKNQYQQSLNQLQTVLMNIASEKAQLEPHVDENFVKLESNNLIYSDHDYTQNLIKDKVADTVIKEEYTITNIVESDVIKETKKSLVIKSYLMKVKKQQSNTYKCTWCKRICTNYRQFYRHIHNHDQRECEICYHPEKPKPEACNHEKHICRHCRFCTGKKSDFKKHLKLHLPTFCKHIDNTEDCLNCLKFLLQINKPGGTKQIKCSLCNILVSHGEIEIHLKQLHFFCIHFNDTEECGWCFDEKADKTNKKIFSCNICGHVYTTNFYLQHHLMKHNNKKNYICQYCGASYLLKQYLTDHMEIHIPGQYTCEYCGKLFTRRITLKRHRYTHLDNRKYKCNICEKAFKQSAHLKTHMIVHSDKKSYSCDICEKRFGLKGTLTKHMHNIHRYKSSQKIRSKVE